MTITWSIRQESLVAQSLLKFTVWHDASPASYAQVMAAWQDDEAFRQFFNQVLADIPFPAFRWETPPLVTSNVHRDFEFVAIDSPGLTSRPDRLSFAEHFARAKKDEVVVTFTNLGQDAILVVPCPAGPDHCYPHLGQFVRHAPESQRSQLWQSVGSALANRISTKPVWLSTAGAGVSWLHVRLDDRPKYYGYEPYRDLHF